MTKASDKKITLTIRGARAERGVSLADFESFIDSFLGPFVITTAQAGASQRGSRAIPIGAPRL